MTDKAVSSIFSRIEGILKHDIVWTHHFSSIFLNDGYKIGMPYVVFVYGEGIIHTSVCNLTKVTHTEVELDMYILLDKKMRDFEKVGPRNGTYVVLPGAIKGFRPMSVADCMMLMKLFRMMRGYGMISRKLEKKGVSGAEWLMDRILKNGYGRKRNLTSRIMALVSLIKNRI